MRPMLLGGALLAALVCSSGLALAQKSGGVLKMYHRDNPPTLSIHESSTNSTVIPMMGVFNNLVVYDQTVAQYRQTVLDGFKEVEDYMAQLRVYEQEAGVRDEALQSARDSLRLTNNQYKAGLIGYLDVVNVQTTALSNERSVLTLLQSRLIASVQLIAALGGGWQSDSGLKLQD